jgi:uncharacterized protein (TIGR00725 family)
MLFLSDPHQQLFCHKGVFDPWTWTWRTELSQSTPAANSTDHPRGLKPVAPVEALGWLFRKPDARRAPVAVIGPKNASRRQIEIGEALGRRLGELHVPMITGGKGGVMEAASRGCLGAGGQPIGILPDDEWSAANSFVTIPIATGLGAARNAVIARAAVVLIAVGGEYGTLSEMALGLHFRRLVLALEDAPEVLGAIRVADVETALERVALRIFGLDEEPPPMSQNGDRRQL